MSDTIDKRVVEMRFDNQQFESRTKTTLGTLAKLKEALNFSHASDGLDQLNKSVKNVNMSGLRSAIDGVQVSFSKMEMMAIRALENITDRVVNMGVSLAKNLTIDQLSAGWDKYADKTTAVQTIMAATKNQFTDTAEQMEFVNAQLDRLNWFTDETSYNFVDMVGNIGKFTSNGIALDDAATAMQGIAVWAAVSGQNASTASRAMYQLSQAMGMGSVRLQDWMSIETANMATYEFKEMVLEAAVAMGTLSKEAEGTYKTVEKGTEVTVKGFRESLKEGWLTSDVLVKVLNQYGGFTNKLYEVSEATGMSATDLLQLMEKYREAGDSASEMLSQVAKENEVDVKLLQASMEELTDDVYALGEKAFRAAQEAKTFGEAIDATRDAVSTGWMKTFEIIFGDYEEARVRWTALANELWDIFASGAEARNELLEEALGLPDSIVQRQTSGWSAVQKAIEDAGIPLDDFIQKCLELGGKGGDGITSIEEFKKSLSEGWLTKDIVAESIDSFIGPVEQVGEVTEGVGKTFEDFKRIVDETWVGSWGNWVPRWRQYTEAGWNWSAMQDAVNKSGQGLILTYEDYQAALEACSDEQLKKLGYTEDEIESIRESKIVYGEFDDTIYDVVNSMGNLRSGSELLFDGISKGWNAIKGIFSAMKAGWEIAFPSMTPERLYDILTAFNAIANKFNDWVGNFDNSDGSALDETVLNIRDTFGGLASIIGIVIDVLKDVTVFLKNNFGDELGVAIDKVLDFTGTIGRFIINLRQWMKDNNIIGRGLSLLSDYIYSIVVGFKNWYDSFAELPWVQKRIEKLTSWFDKIGDTIVKVFPKSSKAVKDLWNRVKVFFKRSGQGGFEGIVNYVKSLGEALKSDLIERWNALKSSNFFGGFVTGLESIWKAIKTLDPKVLPDWVERTWAGIKKFFKPLTDFFSNIKDKLTNAAEDVGKGFEAIGTKIVNAAKYLKEHIGSIIAAFGFFILSRTIWNFISTIINIAKAITAPVTTIVNAISAFQSAATGLARAATGFAIVEIIGSIIALGLAAVELGKVPQRQLIQGVGVVFALTGMVAIIIALLTRFREAGSMLKPKSFSEKIAGMFKLVELAGAMLLVGMAFQKFVEVVDTASLGKIIGAFILMMAAVAVLAGGTIVISKFGGSGGSAMTGPLLGIAAFVYVISEVFQDILEIVQGTADSAKIEEAKTIVLDMVKAVGLLAIALTALNKLPSSGSVSKIGGGIFAVALAVRILVSAMKSITELDFSTWDDKKTNTVVGIITALGLIMAAISFMPQKAGMNGVGIFAAAASVEVLALAIRTMASLDAGDIAKGVIAIGAMMLFIGIFTLLTKRGSELSAKSAVVFIGLSAAILILSGAIALLSLLKEEDVLIGVVAISAMITAVGVMMFLSSIAGDLKITHFIGLSLVIGVLSAAIVVFSFLDPGAVLMGTIAISAMVTACGIMMLLMSAAKGLSIVPFIGLIAVVAVLTLSIRSIAEIDPNQVLTAVASLTAIMAVFTIMSVVLGVVVKLISNQWVECLGILAGLSLVLMAIAAVIVYLTTSVPSPEAALTISLALSALCLSLGRLVPGVAALGKTGDLSGAGGTSIVKGIVGLIAVIAAIGALCIALGKLNEWVPTLQESIESGFPMLRTIGQAFGEVIGGVFEGIFDIDLTNMINQLVLFGGGVKQFSDAISGASFDEGTASAIEAIGSTLLYLAGADILNAIASLFGGDQTSLGDFAADLPAFATALKSFGDNLGDDFDADAVSAAADAAKDLTKMVNSLPTSGGWKAKILGDKESLGDFGDSICTFADDLVDFCSKITDDNVDPDKISTVATAASSLVDLVDNLPAKDGWLQKIIGEPQTLSEFGSSLKEFGTGITDFCDALGDRTDFSPIEDAATAATNLTTLQEALPDEDGWLTNFFGGGKTSLDEFGVQIGAFADAIVTFCGKFGTDVDLTKIGEVTGNVQKLVDLAADDQLSIGDDLEDFGDSVKDFGSDIKKFYENIDEIDSTQIDAISTSAANFLSEVGAFADGSTLDFSGFTSAFSDLGAAVTENFATTFSTSSLDFASAIAGYMKVGQAVAESYEETFGTIGSDLLSEFLSGFSGDSGIITSKIQAFLERVETILEREESTFQTYGLAAVKNYLKEFQNQYSYAKTIGSNFVENVLLGLKQNADRFRKEGLSAASLYAQAISSYASTARSSAASLTSNALAGLTQNIGSARTYGNNFAYTFILGLQGYTNSAYTAAYNIGRSAVRGLQKGIDAHSPSKESKKSADNFGIGFVSNMLKWLVEVGNAAEELGSEAVTRLNLAISKIPDILSGDVDFDPVIRPRVDLTSAQESVQTLNGMFNKSIGVVADVASVTGSAVNVSRVRTVSGDSTQGVEGEKQMSTQPLTIQNTFNITSNDPEEVANTVSRRIQRQVERKEATWAQLSGMRSPLVRSR